MWAVVGKTGIHKCGLNLSSSLWLGSKPLSTCSWRGDSGLSTDLLLVPVSSKQPRGARLLCMTPGLGRPVCGFHCSLPKAGVCSSNLSFSLSPPTPTGLNLFNSFPFLHNSVCIFLTVSILQDSFCQFPVSFQ